MREGLACAREHRLPVWEALIALDAAGLEVVQGDLESGLGLFDATIGSCHQAGAVAQVGALLAALVVFFERSERPESAVAICGTTTHHASTIVVADLPAAVDHLRAVLGGPGFDECIAIGVAMDLSAAVRYARAQIRLAQSELGRST